MKGIIMQELEDIKKILDNDEEVVEYFKPNKKRSVLINILFTGVIFYLFAFGIMLFGILGLTGVTKWTNEDGTRDMFTPLIITLVGLIPLLMHTVSFIGLIVRYKRTLYVITNKRAVIRSGFIGVDYKSLELKNVLSLDVRVDFLDKLVKPNTGSVYFGSAVNYGYNNNNGRQNIYSFSHIDEPYEVYKKIKQHIPEKE